MTIKELIEELKQYDENLQITIDVLDDAGEPDNVPITDVDVEYDISSHSDVVKLYY